MDLEHHLNGNMFHIVSAAIAAITTVVVLWLVSAVAGDYYVEGEQESAAQSSSNVHQASSTQITATPVAHS